MKKLTAYKEWEERVNKDLEFWFSNEGEELQLNLVAQGYTEKLFYCFMVLFGSGFTSIKIIKKLKEEINS